MLSVRLLMDTGFRNTLVWCFSLLDSHPSPVQHFLSVIHMCKGTILQIMKHVSCFRALNIPLVLGKELLSCSMTSSNPVLVSWGGVSRSSSPGIKTEPWKYTELNKNCKKAMVT